MRRIVTVLLSLATLMIPVAAGAQVSWPMYQGNAAHTGYIPVSFDPSDFTLDWEVTLSSGGRYLNSVAAADGRVFATLRIYFDNNHDDLFALDATDGSILWSKDYGDVFSVNAPAYAAGNVYVQVCNHTPDTHVDVYDASTGALLHEAPFAAQWFRYQSPTVVGGIAYINGGYYGGMYAFDFATGPGQLWFNNLDNTNKEEWTPAVDGVYAYGITDDHVVAVKCSDGTDEFRIEHPGVTSNSIGEVRGGTVLGGHNDVLFVHGTSFASFDLGSRTLRYDISSETEIFDYGVSVSKGVAYVNNLGSLEARNQNTGALLWSWTPPGEYELRNNIIITDQHALVFVRDWDFVADIMYGSAVHAIDLTTHTSVWSHQVTESLDPPPDGHLAWSEGRLFIARGDGVLTALRLSSPYEQSSVVQLAASAYSVAENAGTATVMLRRAGSGEGSVGVTISSSDGTAVAGADYTAVNQVVSWGVGDTVDKPVQVAITNDSAIEGAEHLSLRLHSVTGPATLGALSAAQVTIEDDDIDMLRFSSASTDVNEAGATVTLHVTRSGPASGEVTVDWATANGTASAGSDYTAASDKLSWGVGETGAKAITVSILDDDFDEDNETFTVILSNPSPIGVAILGSPSVFTATIVDDDGPQVQFGAGIYEIDEAAGTVDLAVTRTGNAAGAVSVDWATGGGTATAGQDYVADSGTLIWGDGDGDDKIISLTLMDDGATEGGESFEVGLSNPVGANISLGEPDTALVSISDDEATEGRINTTVQYAQVRPSVAMNASGTTVVVWDSWKQDGDQWGIFGQRLDIGGDPVGGEFPVNTTATGEQMIPAVAVSTGGGFMVAWQAEVTVGTEIAARRFNAVGSPMGTEFVVNSSTSGNQTAPRVAVDGNGRYIVVWQGRDASGPGVFARVYGADGIPLGEEFVVNTTTTGSQGAPDVAGFPSGGFLVVWESYGQDVVFTDAVIGRRFASNGSPLGGEILVNESMAGDQSLPAAAVASNGRFLVAWEDRNGLDGAFGSIRGRWFDSSGSPITGELQINLYTAGDQGRLAVAAEPNGRAVVVWEGRAGQDGSETGVFARSLYDDGSFASTEIQLNTYTSDSQDEPAVACSRAGSFLGVWRSEGQDGPPLGADGVYGVVWPLPPPQLIFADGFESGDTTAW
jgi:hypothetical protein